MISRWLRALLPSPRSSSSQQRPKRLQLEVLEDRCALSALNIQALPANQQPLGAALGKVITGNGVQITNAAYSGSSLAAGVFSGGNDDLGISSGVVLDTGLIASIPGRLTIAAGNPPGTALGQPGDAQLNAILPAGTKSLDASVLTFSFVAQGPMVSLSFVFASNEYNAAGTALNSDTFAAFLNGKNEALINGVNNAAHFVTPANIETLNVDRNNDPRNVGGTTSPLDIKFDRLSTVLTINAAVVPGNVNTLKLVIADVGATPGGNSVVDSAVFIQAQSFLAGPRLTAAFPVRYTYDAATRTYLGYITIQNIGNTTFAANFTDPGTGNVGTAGLSLTGLPPGVTGVGKTNLVSLLTGQTFIPLPGSLAPGQVVRIPVRFSDPLGLPLPTYFSAQQLDIQYF
jgi:hypothetical protein